MTNSRILRLDANLLAQEIDILDGHLLGDGSVFKIGKDRIHCLFSFTCKHREYIEWLIDNTYFLSDRPIYPVSYFDKRTGKTYSRYYTKSLSGQMFTTARQRWYPEGKKILPDDVIISSRCLLRFYLDDGYYLRNSLYLSTNDFSLKEVETLAQKIGTFCNIPLRIHSVGGKAKEEYKLYIGRRYKQQFLDIIGHCPVSCYSYKWGE